MSGPTLESDRPMIVAEGLSKSFGDVDALSGIHLTVPQGTILGLLGPNGAGKTTAVRIFTTLIPPDGGRAEVAGYDVSRDAVSLRSAIGLAGQYAAVDENLTGRENLELVGRLYHLSKVEARRRADGLLERFDLTSAASRTVKTYSGGMRRRLDLGASLVGRPEVLFLDEPTTGLDPSGRLGLWDVIEDLVKDGTTLLLTTQYLEEADYLADSIVVIDQGHVIAEGTSDELKSRVGGEVLEVTVGETGSLDRASTALSSLGSGAPRMDGDQRMLRVSVDDGASLLAEAVRRLDAEAVPIADLAVRRPTLDDVFLALTGHGAEADGSDHAGSRSGAKRSRRRRDGAGGGGEAA